MTDKVVVLPIHVLLFIILKLQIFQFGLYQRHREAACRLFWEWGGGGEGNGERVLIWRIIGVGRFRILGGGGARFRILGGGQVGAKFPAGTWRRNDVDAT